MRIPEEVRSCVAFVGYSDIFGKMYLAGTAFSVFRRIDGEMGFAYLVTAKHVIEKIKAKGCQSASVRFNLVTGGAAWIGISLDHWFYHPSDDHTDVAVWRIPSVAQKDIATIPYLLEASVTRDVISKESIGVGTEVFLSGLFINHYGRERNIPIVRVGNIAAMPEEKVSTEMGPMDAYLIEARSIGGLSGSPVFAHLGILRLEKGTVLASSNDHGIFYLLGLMHGHWDTERPTVIDIPEEDAPSGRINMGIGIVVPAEKILETINHPGLVAIDALELEEIRRCQLCIKD